MADREAIIRSWQQDRFGMFIHWGLYSVDGLDCWKMHDMGIPIEEYIRRFEPRFNPVKFDAGALVGVAKSAGCRYVVMGSRHHEGYCLWNTKTTGFSSVAMTPKRDFIAELTDAARQAGLKVGLYYSLLDWRFKAYWDGPWKNPVAWDRLVEYVHAQVRELMTLYGRIDILWYDGAWGAEPWGGFGRPGADFAKAWKAEELNAMVRKLQPDILINNRSYLPEDFGTPEQTITPEDRPWEMCDTMGERWGASPQDLTRKSAREIVTRLIACVSLGGNMLLNVGPNPDGSVQGWQASVMKRIGAWMQRHGEAIYGCGGEWKPPFNNALAPWKTTRRAEALYLHLIQYPGTSFSIANLHDYWFESATLLDTGRSLGVTHEPTRDIISGLPARAPDDIAPVVRVKTRPKTANEIAMQQTIGIERPEVPLALS